MPFAQALQTTPVDITKIQILCLKTIIITCQLYSTELRISSLEVRSDM